MSATATYTPEELAHRVHDLIRAYVMARTDLRSPVAWGTFKDSYVIDEQSQRRRLNVPSAYREAREKVCLDAFLAMRGRRSREDFIAYFTGTICSVPQFLPREEHAKLAQKLLSEPEGWEEVKSLAMLALAGLASV